jgi:glutamine amidotransferase
MDVGIINYGLGNIRSLSNSIKKIEKKFEIISNPKDIKQIDKIILPGVGSFKKAMGLIEKQKWDIEIKKYIHNKKNRILGICLGMQLLGSIGYEFGNTSGLDLIKGEVKFLRDLGCKKNLPHIGWNDVEIKQNNILFRSIPNNSSFYFVNSYSLHLESKLNEIGSSNYGLNFTSAVNNKNIFGVQFHPEKSSKVGLQLLKNFIDA